MLAYVNGDTQQLGVVLGILAERAESVFLFLAVLGRSEEVVEFSLEVFGDVILF